MRVEQHLRATLRELADQARGIDELAGTAMIHGVRMRRRRRLAAMAGAAALLLVALIPFALKGAPAPEVGAVSSGHQLSEVEPRALPGGWIVAGVHDWAYNRRTNSYNLLRSQRTQPGYLAAPAGDLAAIVSRDADRTKDVIDFVTTGMAPVSTVETASNGVYRWSPQGDRLVTGIPVRDPRAGFGFGFAIIDARTGQIAEHRIDRLRFDCSMCALTWSRDGREVALGIADRRGGEAHEFYTGVQFFDAGTGEPTRQIGLRAMFSSPFSWSPNGRYVIASADDTLTREYQLIDTRTFERRPFPYNAVFVTDDLLLAAERDAIVALLLDGSVVARFELTGRFSGLGETATFGTPG